MNTLCTRLKNVDEAGVYQLNCSVDELRAAVALAGYTLFEADLAQVQGKGEFLAAMARAITAPDWFGHNFDALADALGDIAPASGYVLLLRHGGDMLGLSDVEHHIAMEVFSSTTAFWKSQGKPFWVFFA